MKHAIMSSWSWCSQDLQSALSIQVELSSGSVTDRYTIENDCVDLANNNGAYLYDDMLAILTVGLPIDSPSLEGNPLICTIL